AEPILVTDRPNDSHTARRRSGIGARGGLVLPARLAGHDLGFGRGRVDRGLLGAVGGLAERVAILVVVLVLAGDGVLELAHPGAELTAQPRKALGAEDDENDEEDDPQLERSDARHATNVLPERGSRITLSGNAPVL